VTTRFYRRLKTAPTIGRLAPAYASFALLKHIVSLPTLARWAWQRQRGPRNPKTERSVIAAVAHLRHWFGAQEGCLQSSLVLYRELSALGADPKLAVGFRRHDNRVEGHAWVIVDGRVIPGESYAQPFVPAFQFGRGGVLHGEADR
jgi:transglutaminase superfamily protein